MKIMHRVHTEVVVRASDTVDVENIKHITENQTLIGDLVGKTADDWKAQKELFYQKTGSRHQPVIVSHQDAREEKEKFSQQDVAEEQDNSEDFSKELEEVLLSAQND
ncbi:putative calmodulin-like protein 5-like [Capsicum annuum]|nr:putative calmodulin-like protein 5-like [Capsicum annuum]